MAILCHVISQEIFHIRVRNDGCKDFLFNQMKYRVIMLKLEQVSNPDGVFVIGLLAPNGFNILGCARVIRQEGSRML